jgi:tetratricopeptide (TPR) repeat protein
VHYNLGTLYAESNHYGEARAELRAALDLDPAYAAAWANLAIVCEKLEMDKEAIEANEKVISLGKAAAGTYFRLGVLYAKVNNPDPAISNLAKAVQLEPDKYRALLKEELKNVHSVLDSIRYKDAFVRLLGDK